MANEHTVYTTYSQVWFWRLPVRRSCNGKPERIREWV